MKRKVRYVMIGFGGIAENRVAREGFACDRRRFRPLSNAELVGATDLNPARRAAVEKLGLRWYGSLEEALADSGIGAIYIATNNRSHVPLAMECLKAGKHVIVEKPIATSVADAKKLSAFAKRKGLSLAVNHMMVHNAWHLAAKSVMDTKRLGTVNDCCFHMEFAFGYDPAEAKTWRCNNVAEMGGPIGDVASHCFSVAESMFGKKIVKVASVYYPKLMKTKAEDGAYIRFYFEDGLQGSVRAAFCEKRGGLAGTITNLGFEVYGDKAAMRGYGTMFQLSGYADEPVVQRVEIDDGRQVIALKPKKIRNLYQSVIENHAASVITKRPLSGRDAMHNLALCMAAHESARKGGKLIVVK